jgi:hypothetical protein
VTAVAVDGELASLTTSAEAGCSGLDRGGHRHVRHAPLGPARQVRVARMAVRA